MPIAILTKYLGATNTRGSRIKATAKRGRETVTMTVPYDHAASDAFQVGAEALRDKYWPGETLYRAGVTLDNGDIFTINPLRA
jgi:hypothetical protein